MITINKPLLVSLLGALALTQQISASSDPAESRRMQPHGMWQNREFRRSISEYLCAKDLFNSLIHTSKALGQSVADVQMKEGKDYIEWLDKMYKRGASNRVVAMEVAAALTRCPWATIGNGCTIKASMAAMFHNNTFHFDACRAYELSSWKYANTPDLRDALRDKWVRKFVIDLMAEKKRPLSESDIQELEQAKKIRSDILPEVEPVLESLRPPAAAHLMHSLLYSGCSCDPLMVPPSSNIIKQLLARTVDCEVLNEFMPFVRSAFRINASHGSQLQTKADGHGATCGMLVPYFAALEPAKNLDELRALIDAEDQLMALQKMVVGLTLASYAKFIYSSIARYEKMLEQYPKHDDLWHALIKLRLSQFKLRRGPDRVDYATFLKEKAREGIAALIAADRLALIAHDPKNLAQRPFLVPLVIDAYKYIKRCGASYSSDSAQVDGLQFPELVFGQVKKIIDPHNIKALIDNHIADFQAALDAPIAVKKPTIELEEKELNL